MFKQSQVNWVFLIIVLLARIIIEGSKLIRHASFIVVAGDIELRNGVLDNFWGDRIPIIRNNKTAEKQELKITGVEISIENFTELNRNLRS